jgi:uncharacterized protein (DUF433 family)
MNYQNLITSEPGGRGGKPCNGGMRITVSDVVEYLASGITWQEVLVDFPTLWRQISLRVSPMPQTVSRH